jgi:exopolyphosphatase/guanosine-5'-triphosphate,3'-diphosphate pyrophosphatase
MRAATIDIGTNTVLLLVAEKRDDGTIAAIEEHARITRLGQGVDRTRRLAPEAIARTNEVLDAYAEIVARAKVDRVAVVGTSAMRAAGGGETVRAHVKARFGVDARTISGDEEARLTFAGALSGVPKIGASDEVVVFDIGGGSTEVVRGDRSSRAIAYARSFDVGSVRLTERHVRTDPPTVSEQEAVYREAVDAFASVPAAATEAPPVGIAGTMTTLAAVSLAMQTYDAQRVHGLTLETAEIARVVRDVLAPLPVEERRRVVGIEPKRADVIVAGGLVALAFLAQARADRVTISDRGVRWGLADELLAR